MGDRRYWTVNLDTVNNRAAYGDIHAALKAFCDEHGLVMSEYVERLIDEAASQPKDQSGFGPGEAPANEDDTGQPPRPENGRKAGSCA